MSWFKRADDARGLSFPGDPEGGYGGLCPECEDPGQDFEVPYLIPPPGQMGLFPGEKPTKRVYCTDKFGPAEAAQLDLKHAECAHCGTVVDLTKPKGWRSKRVSWLKQADDDAGKPKPAQSDYEAGKAAGLQFAENYEPWSKYGSDDGTLIFGECWQNMEQGAYYEKSGELVNPLLYNGWRAAKDKDEFKRGVVDGVHEGFYGPSEPPPGEGLGGTASKTASPMAKRPGNCESCGKPAEYACGKCGATVCGGCGRIPSDYEGEWNDTFLCMACEEEVFPEEVARDFGPVPREELDPEIWKQLHGDDEPPPDVPPTPKFT